MFKIIFYVSLILINLTLPFYSKGQVEAELAILKQSGNTSAENNLLFVTLSFKNKTNKDIYVPYVIPLLTDTSGRGVFAIYRNGQLIARRLDYQLSGKLEHRFYKEYTPGETMVIAHTTPLFQLQQEYRNPVFNYVVDSVTGYNKTKNYKIADSFLNSPISKKFDSSAVRFLINANALFLKKDETHNYYFLSNIGDILQQPGDYIIMYEPTFKKPKTSFLNPAIENILNFERFIPTRIECNTLSIKVI